MAYHLHATQLRAVLREYLQFRFWLPPSRDAREIVQAATVSSIQRSPRCKSWELRERPGDPSRLVLHVQWEGDEEQEIFRGSQECSDFFRALAARVRQLEESDYRTDEASMLESLGGTQDMLQLVGDILREVRTDRLLGLRFGPPSGDGLGRLGLWLIEVLGGPKLYSSTTSARSLRVGPLPDEPLDVEERAQLLELVRHALRVAGSREHSVLGLLEANLPLHPALPSPSSATPQMPEALPANRERFRTGVRPIGSVDRVEQDPRGAGQTELEELIIHEDLLVPPRELLG
jgi:truncated hemoglobin YjbI